MGRGFAALCLAPLALVAILPGTGQCGYRLDSIYHSDTRTYWYSVEVESGSPPQFRDFHVEAKDPDPSNYALVLAPPGWEMSIVPMNPGVWICFYGSTPCSSAIFKVEYSGRAQPKPYSDWILTSDGNSDPHTGRIRDQEGSDALGPWFVTGLNTEMKVGLHVMQHEERTCGRNFPDINTCSDIVATCEANDVDFFPVFYDIVEYSGLEFSVEWPGTYSCVFNACGYTQMGTIVWPAGTVPVEEGEDYIGFHFVDCQLGPVAIPGWGWIYEPGPATIRLVPSTQSGVLRTLDCIYGGYTNEPICNFAAGIGGALGEQPCGPSTSEPKTWGAIKALFR